LKYLNHKKNAPILKEATQKRKNTQADYSNKVRLNINKRKSEQWGKNSLLADIESRFYFEAKNNLYKG
jgi:hypothetical protein